MFKILHCECLHHSNLLKMNHELSELALNPVWSLMPSCTLKDKGFQQLCSFRIRESSKS